jgi:hypothetical protein
VLVTARLAVVTVAKLVVSVAILASLVVKVSEDSALLADKLPEINDPVTLTLPRTVSPDELALVKAIQLAAIVIPSLGQIQRVLVIVLNHS